MHITTDFGEWYPLPPVVVGCAALWRIGASAVLAYAVPRGAQRVATRGRAVLLLCLVGAVSRRVIARR